jgi:alkylation response protein AidB-like acyl-CoA dehydrogenase
MGVVFPEEYGGAGFGYGEYITVVEGLSRVCGSVGLTVAAHVSLCSNHIYMCGNEEQKKKYLPDLASGRKIGAWGLTEPGSGSDAAGLKTRAVLDGDHWVLDGTKNFITNATVAETAVVLANTDPEKGTNGVSAFILEKGMPGFRAGKKENKMGMRASDTAEQILESVRVPKENLLGKRGEGFKDAMRILDGGRVSIAALAVGIAQGAYEASLQYAKTREQFGKPIAEFQAVQWMLADAATRIEAARLLTRQAGHFLDVKHSRPHLSSIAKLYAGETAVKVTADAVQIFGGYGLIKDYPVEKYYRDVKLTTIGEGTSEIQRLVISRHLLGRSTR